MPLALARRERGEEDPEWSNLTPLWESKKSERASSSSGLESVESERASSGGKERKKNDSIQCPLETLQAFSLLSYPQLRCSRVSLRRQGWRCGLQSSSGRAERWRGKSKERSIERPTRAFFFFGRCSLRSQAKESNEFRCSCVPTRPQSGPIPLA